MIRKWDDIGNDALERCLEGLVIWGMEAMLIEGDRCLSVVMID